ncbi:MAG: hypothetical protein IKN55_01595 [Oscillospiraceae bacterium]|nr:hypothetical protein [Oscillospiraceae bacterium]
MTTMAYRRRTAWLLLAAVLLTGCGGNTSQMDSLIAAQEATEAPAAEPSAPATEALPTAPVPASAFIPAEGDVDLTVLESTMVYAQVFDMVSNPDAYTGRNIRARGPFAYYKDESTGKEYFAVLISDATACCAQGVEFVLDGDPVYPDDYPEAGTEITVSGVFHSYEENGTTYVQLLHASIE